MPFTDLTRNHCRRFLADVLTFSILLSSTSFPWNAWWNKLSSWNQMNSHRVLSSFTWILPVWRENRFLQWCDSGTQQLYVLIWFHFTKSPHVSKNLQSATMKSTYMLIKFSHTRYENKSNPYTVYTVTTQNWERIHYELQKDKASAEYITSPT